MTAGSALDAAFAAALGAAYGGADRGVALHRDHCAIVGAGEPLGVVRATTRSQVVSTLRLAHERRVPVVTRGAGTGLAGGANAITGGIILDVSGMDRLIELDPDGRTATVEPGVLNGRLDRAAREVGLFYPPDPGSRAISTIGGNLATNAGGMCCAKYGVTSDHALALTVVLPGGDVIMTGKRTRKNVVGLDLTRLMVGSEGTLGVIVEATVRLLPTPSRLTTAVMTFPDVATATAAVLAITEVVTPCAVELMDSTTVGAVNAMTRMGLEEAALILVQCDGPDPEIEIAAVTDVARQHGAQEVLSTDDEAEGIAFMEARRLALTALERLGSVLLDDVCVPIPRLPALQAGIEKAALKHDVLVGTFGHAADGNLHPTIVYDPRKDGDRERATACFDAIIELALALDGTVSGEHGVGSLKTPYVERQVGAGEQALMHRIKAAFDPRNILNPGRAY